MFWGESTAYFKPLFSIFNTVNKSVSPNKTIKSFPQRFRGAQKNRILVCSKQSEVRTGENKTNILTVLANQTQPSKSHTNYHLLQEQNTHKHIYNWVPNLRPVQIHQEESFTWYIPICLILSQKEEFFPLQPKPLFLIL